MSFRTPAPAPPAARHGLWAALMTPVVAGLTEEDLVNIAAYTASLTP